MRPPVAIVGLLSACALNLPIVYVLVHDAPWGSQLWIVALGFVAMGQARAAGFVIERAPTQGFAWFMALAALVELPLLLAWRSLSPRLGGPLEVGAEAVLPLSAGVFAAGLLSVAGLAGGPRPTPSRGAA